MNTYYLVKGFVYGPCNMQKPERKPEWGPYKWDCEFGLFTDCVLHTHKYKWTGPELPDWQAMIEGKDFILEASQAGDGSDFTLAIPTPSTSSGGRIDQQGVVVITLATLIRMASSFDFADCKKEITDAVWEELMNDNFCPNSIPIHYVKRLVQKIQLPFFIMAIAIENSFDKYVQKNPIPINGNQTRHLWENKESLNKYLTRLNELLRVEQQTSVYPVWVKASDRLPVGKVKWRDADTKKEISQMAADSAMRTDQKEFVEWLDQTALQPLPDVQAQHSIEGIAIAAEKLIQLIERKKRQSTWEKQRVFQLRYEIEEYKEGKSATDVQVLVDALNEWKRVHEDFDRGYKNVDGKETRVGIAALSQACNDADKNLRQALNQYNNQLNK